MPEISLSMREKGMLNLILKGKSSREIAEVFGVTPKYMQNLLNKLRKRLDAKNYKEAAQNAKKQGLLP